MCFVLHALKTSMSKRVEMLPNDIERYMIIAVNLINATYHNFVKLITFSLLFCASETSAILKQLELIIDLTFL
jgi:hypothetical protein